MTSPAAVPIRDAATVVLLRDGAAGIEAWLLTRVTQMVFAAGMTVFPGGRVDPADVDLPLVGADLPALATRFGCELPLMHAIVAAAVRETFEETGVLLTVPTADLSGSRSDVEQGRVPFGELLRAHGLAGDAGALYPWARWITPAGESRRYDTRFFVGVLPVGAQAHDVTSESSGASWVEIGTAIEQARRGERRMLAPTLTTLASLLPFASVSDVVAASPDRPLDPTQPKLRIRDGVVTVELPDGTVLPVPEGMFR